MTADVELYIEELVVHGLAPGARDGYADQLVAAVTAAVAEHGVGAWAHDGAHRDVVVARLAPPPATAATPTAAAPAEQVGAAIAATLR